MKQEQVNIAIRRLKELRDRHMRENPWEYSNNWEEEDEFLQYRWNKGLSDEEVKQLEALFR